MKPKPKWSGLSVKLLGRNEYMIQWRIKRGQTKKRVKKSMTELFEIPEMLSPRLAWMKKLGVVTEQSPKHDVGCEDEVGNFVQAWYAHFKADAKTAMGGATEQEALCNFAKYHNLKLWNEEGLKSPHAPCTSQASTHSTS